MLKVTPYLELDEQTKNLVDHLHGTMVALTFSEAAVLAALLQNPDAVMTKEALLEIGWPERVVAPTSLTQCISTLRKKLEPYSEVQLKTLARRGYQLHVSEQSNVKMVTLNDAESLRDIVTGVSTRTKIVGIVLLCLLAAVIWYISDYHNVLKHSAKWHGEKTIPLNVGGSRGEATLIYRDGMEKLHPSWWQKHIAPEGNHVAGMKDFSAFALADGSTYSMAICPGQSYQECSGSGLINIAAIKDEPAGLNMSEFIPLTEKMEQRIRYNRIKLPQASSGDSEMTEHNYHADVYFPVAGELLIRNDITMSLIYNKPDAGTFYFSSCVTDQDCQTTPIKYRLRGAFTQYQMKIGNFDADVFHVKVSQKTLTKPEEISPSAVHFFREIRKHDVLDDELYFYRLYQNEHTAVWIVPRMGNFIAWTKYQKLNL
ncbi:CadC family transcriptional regulator [Shewanella sp. NFH-SH190041]|uniref:winged helix-turn-helix domain-containing protein n=1 Tax=Shewanella sp. NFH-SH190041 TaxID=2950245 RepID=UPI0021C25FB8|nr:helix-turn-helix domain-containing protein [Shewanella sp. NFH-SH190041]BDM62998.1 CadC family transcriptional regulator [Shewanella sp. NFH-SH190041]